MQERPWHRHYDPGVPRDLEPVRESLPELLERSLARFPARPALCFRGLRLSHAELHAEIGRVSAGLAALGVARGTRVAIQLPNLPQTAIAYQAALRLGAVVVMTNPLYTPDEVRHQWQDAGCEVAVVADFLWDQRLRALRSELPVRHYVVARIPEYLPWPSRWLAPLVLRRRVPPAWAPLERAPHLTPYAELRRWRGPPVPRAELGPEDPAVLQYTGGTTGRSRAAVLSHGNLVANVLQIRAWFTGQEEGREVVLGCLPLFHVFGMTVSMNYALAIGGAIALVTDPRDIPGLVRTIVRERVTLFPAVPALIASIAQHAGAGGQDLTSIKACISGSAPLPEDVLQRFERLTGCRIVEGYGLSETSPVTHCNPMGGRRAIGSIGMPLPGTDARVVDAEEGRRELSTGEAGELLVRGPQVMSGYWRRPEETAAALVDGWFRTGDLASVDEQGYFRIVGRKKEMINVGGLKVYPDEVDRLLAAHPAVLEAATIGVPIPGKGEIVKSFAVLRPGAAATAQDLVEFLRPNLAPYKLPREVEFLTELPRSTVLKVLRRELLARELARRGQA